MADTGQWRCSACFCKWENSKIKCGACEAYKPGLSEADVRALEAEDKKKKEATISMFKSPAADIKPSGFGFGASPASAGASTFSFGTAADSTGEAPAKKFSFGSLPGTGAATSPAPVSFSFGQPAGTSGGGFTFGTAIASTSGGFQFGAAGTGAGKSTAPSLFGSTAATAPSAFGAATAPAAAPSFGFGMSSGAPAAPAPIMFGSGATGFVLTAAPAPAVPAGKRLASLPDFNRKQEVPLGDVFVHGSGECDQLGLGDDQRERKKPTLLKKLAGEKICDVAVGALHVVCGSSLGSLYSWGCNDDGALGRPTDKEDEHCDCEPRLVPMPAGVLVRSISCGDNHTCALDTLGRVWLWGTYKDANGHIGIARKRKHEAVLEKSDEPAVVLEGCTKIASGGNHTLALKSSPVVEVFSWGSNGTGQLGLAGDAGCGYAEQVVPAGTAIPDLKPRAGGGTEIRGKHVVRICECTGAERSSANMTVEQVKAALSAGATAVVLEIPEREVPKTEKRGLLVPQKVVLEDVKGTVDAIFASAECTFVTTTSQKTYGCGLNGDGQVGLGFASMVVKTLKLVPGASGASYVGGGLHSSAALIGTKVFTWGQADQCGLGLGPDKEPVLQPREVTGLPEIRTLRCGGNHMLATSVAGDVFTWGCGLTYQLGNRPRDVSNPVDSNEDPEDELRPYSISSRQLGDRYVLLADGGAQHSVELAWNSEYGSVPKMEVQLAAPDEAAAPVQEADERPAKKRAVANGEDGRPVPQAEEALRMASTDLEDASFDVSGAAGASLLGVAGTTQPNGDVASPAVRPPTLVPDAPSVAPLAQVGAADAMEAAIVDVARRVTSVGVAAAEKTAAAFTLESAMLRVAANLSAAADRAAQDTDAVTARRIEAEVLRCFAGGLASEFKGGELATLARGGPEQKTTPRAAARATAEEHHVLWSARPGAAPVAQGPGSAADAAGLGASATFPMTERERAALADKLPHLSRAHLEKLLLEAAQLHRGVWDSVQRAYEASI